MTAASSARPLLRSWLLAAVGLAPALLAADAPSVELWTRRAGNHSVGAVLSGDNVERLDLRGVVDAGRLDPHFGKTNVYRGVDLEGVLRKARARGDLALLHTKNGMIVPLPLDDDTLKTVGPFLALQRKNEAGVFAADFPPVPRQPGLNLDRRPLVFSGNMLVVKSAAHPWAPKGQNGEPVISPWRYADSLAAIEVVDQRAYFAQLEPPAGAAAAAPDGGVADAGALDAGFSIFKTRCIYCHALRGVGGRFGWDFVDPLPIHTLRDPKALLLQVTTKHLFDVDMGLAMPPQKDFSADDAKALWAYLEAMARPKTLPAYEPPKR